MRKSIAIALAVAGLAACSTEQASVTEPEQTETTTTEEPEPEETQQPVKPKPEPEPEPEPAVEIGDFVGTGFTFSDGLQLTVTDLQAYEPSEWASYDDSAPAHVRFTVTIVNGSEAPYDPTLASVTMSSGGVESEQIFDSENGLEGGPSTTVLPGDSISFSAGFSVADPADLLLEASPGWDYEASLFQGGL